MSSPMSVSTTTGIGGRAGVALAAAAAASSSASVVVAGSRREALTSGLARRARGEHSGRQVVEDRVLAARGDSFVVDADDTVAPRDEPVHLALGQEILRGREERGL